MTKTVIFSEFIDQVKLKNGKPTIDGIEYSVFKDENPGKNKVKWSPIVNISGTVKLNRKSRMILLNEIGNIERERLKNPIALTESKLILDVYVRFGTDRVKIS